MWFLFVNRDYMSPKSTHFTFVVLFEWVVGANISRCIKSVKSCWATLVCLGQIHVFFFIKCVIEAIEESFFLFQTLTKTRFVTMNPKALCFPPSSLILNTIFLPFFSTLFSTNLLPNTRHIFDHEKGGRLSTLSRGLMHRGYSPLCIMDSLRLYRVIALLERGWG